MKPHQAIDDHSQGPVQLSPSGQLIGWAVFGGLVLVGFFFGIVTGYENPKPVQVAKANRDREKGSTKPSTPATPKEVTHPQPAPPAVPPLDQPPKADPPKADPPKADPPKPDPPRIATVPRKEEPKTPVLVPVSFQREVMPILRTHCLNCHGASAGKPKGGVNLTSIANMMKSRGKVLTPGKPQESDVYTSITEREMPDGGRPKPTQKELATLRNWILSGAKQRRRFPAKHAALPSSRD